MSDNGPQAPGPAPAPGEGSSVALALVNTLLRGRGGELDLLRGPDSVASWLAERTPAGARPRIRRVDVTRLASLRAAVHEVFTAVADERAPERGAVAVLNEYAAAVPRAVQLHWSPAGPERSLLARRSTSVDAAMAAIATDAIEVVCGSRGPLLRRCEARGCVRVFLREHARRRWCSTACGDRVRAARHYARTQHRAAHG